MINILIVDDNQAKIQKISDAITDLFLGAKIHIEVSKNAYAAIQVLHTQTFDLVVLDLNIPMREDAPPRPDGGLRLLHSIKNDKTFRTPTHIIGLTAFDELHGQHKSRFEDEGWVLLLYEDSSNAWEVSLRHKLAHIAGTKESPATHEMTKPSPWVTGSFYLFATLVVAVLFAAIAQCVPGYALALVILGVLLVVPGIGFLQLKHDRLLHDRSIVALYKAYFRALRLLGRLRLRKPVQEGFDKSQREN